MRPRTSAWFVQILYVAIILIFTAVSFLTGCARGQPAFHIENPYARVDWAKHVQYKAILHSHTTMGAGDTAPPVVIDYYRELGYAILALTDHDDEGPAEQTWPWQVFRVLHPKHKK